MVIEFRMELGNWGMNAKPLNGAKWRATMVIDCQIYAGSDDDPWCAIAWCLCEYSLRVSGVIMPAKSGSPSLAVAYRRALANLISVGAKRPARTKKRRSKDALDPLAGGTSDDGSFGAYVGEASLTGARKAKRKR
jgi:hypothetical protein